MNRQVCSICAALISAAALLAAATTASAQLITSNKGESLEECKTGWLPYAFATESLGTAVGIGGGVSGVDGQRQSSLLGTAMVTSNDSGLVAGAFSSYRVPGTERLFLDVFGLLSHYTDDRVYADPDPVPGRPPDGSNESSEFDFLTGITNDRQLEIGLRYPLAIGALREDPITRYTLDGGVLAEDTAAGRRWNPLKYGRTRIGLTLFGRNRELDDDFNDPDNELLFYTT